MSKTSDLYELFDGKEKEELHCRCRVGTGKSSPPLNLETVTSVLRAFRRTAVVRASNTNLNPGHLGDEFNGF